MQRCFRALLCSTEPGRKLFLLVLLLLDPSRSPSSRMRWLGRRRDHRRVAERLRQWAQLPSRPRGVHLACRTTFPPRAPQRGRRRRRTGRGRAPGASPRRRGRVRRGTRARTRRRGSSRTKRRRAPSSRAGPRPGPRPHPCPCLRLFAGGGGDDRRRRLGGRRLGQREQFTVALCLWRGAGGVGLCIVGHGGRRQRQRRSLVALPNRRLLGWSSLWRPLTGGPRRCWWVRRHC
mgnify:CR=1 FL=1